MQCKKARISFQMGQEQLIQGMWYFYNRLLSFNKCLYSFLIAATPEVVDLINENHHDMVGNYLDDLLGKSMDFSYEELSRIVLGLHPKT